MADKQSRLFAAVPESVAAVRAFVRGTVHEMDKEVAEEIELLASELASNAVEHAGTDYEVRVLPGPGTLRVEVADGSSVLPAVITRLPIDAERGRGLQLLNVMADSWGASEEQAGKTVWFQVTSIR